MKPYTSPHVLELGTMARVTRKTGDFGDPGQAGASESFENLSFVLQLVCRFAPFLAPDICTGIVPPP